MTEYKSKPLIPNKETYTRMNFMYQASMLMASRNPTLSAYFGQQCRSIGKKAQLRISPDLKRDLCKRCSLAQYPGVTTDLDVFSQKKRRRKKKHVQNDSKNIDDQAEVLMTCRKCGFKRKLIVNNEFKFWLENPASISEEVIYDEKNDRKEKNKEVKEKEGNDILL